MRADALSPGVSRMRAGSGWAPALVVLVSSLLAVLFGLIAFSANPVFGAFAAAALVGPMLAARPNWMISLVLVLGLLLTGIVQLHTEGIAGKGVWGVSALSFLLLLVALFRVLTDAEARRRTPAFVWLLLAFIGYALLNTMVQWQSAYQGFSGFKRYFQAYGVLFALAWLPIREEDVRRWRVLLLAVALIQLPFAAYELLKLVPLREAVRFGYPGMVPIDVVAGTFGASLYGGGANAEMATFLIVCFAFLLSRLRAGLLTARRVALMAPFILAPLFLGETKVVVVLLPLMFLTLYRREMLARPLIAFGGLVLGAAMTVGAGMAYLSITKQTLEQQVANTLSYNVYEKGYAGYRLNRTTVLSYWADRLTLAEPVSAVIGNGLGAASDKTGGHVAMRMPGMGIGLTAASVLLWEQGVVGTALFLSVLLMAWVTAGRLHKRASDPAVRADASAIQAALPLFAFYLIYRVAMLETLSFQLVFASMLGYLAWMHRREAQGLGR